MKLFLLFQTNHTAHIKCNPVRERCSVVEQGRRVLCALEQLVYYRLTLYICTTIELTHTHTHIFLDLRLILGSRFRLSHIKFKVDGLIKSHHFHVVLRVGELRHVHKQCFIVHLERGEHAGNVRNMDVRRLEDVLK